MNIGAIEDSEIKSKKPKEAIEPFTLNPNKTFNVPLPWIMHNMSILYERQKEVSSENEILIYQLASTLPQGSNQPKLSFKSQFLNYKESVTEY